MKSGPLRATRCWLSRTGHRRVSRRGCASAQVCVRTWKLERGNILSFVIRMCNTYAHMHTLLHHRDFRAIYILFWKACTHVGQGFICRCVFVAMYSFLIPFCWLKFCGVPPYAWQIRVRRGWTKFAELWYRVGASNSIRTLHKQIILIIEGGPQAIKIFSVLFKIKHTFQNVSYFYWQNILQLFNVKRFRIVISSMTFVYVAALFMLTHPAPQYLCEIIFKTEEVIGFYTTNITSLLTVHILP
jgi:hypothetical protein